MVIYGKLDREIQNLIIIAKILVAEEVGVTTETERGGIK